MSTNVFSLADVARLIGISRSQAFREMLSWPHNGTGADATFTAEQVAEIKGIMSAGPEEQAARQKLIEDKLAARRAEDERELNTTP
ncbi:hypothetical protein [Pseudarthrobacter siccitolerans]